MPRSELQDILWRHRRFYRHEHSLLVHELLWSTPGTVWATDHAEAPEPIDGRYPYVLSVRDLASGKELLWAPVEDLSAETTASFIESLFVREGAPLVLKSDNHGAFRGEAMRLLLDRFGVVALPSPARKPSYNGSAEAGIGQLKRATDYEAFRSARPGRWAMEDLEVARRRVDSRLVAGQSRDARWCARPAITERTRAAFRETVEEKRLEAQREREYDDSPGPRAEDEIMRVSVRRALVAHGFLDFRSRRIPLPLRHAMRAKIM